MKNLSTPLKDRVLRYDGTLLMDTDANARVGSQYAHLVQDLRLNDVETGQFEQDVGKPQRELTAYRASRLYPFVLVTHLHREHALQSWKMASQK